MRGFRSDEQDDDDEDPHTFSSMKIHSHCIV